MQFMQLMDLAQRRVVLESNDINQHGRPHEEMFLIVEGTADVGSGRERCFLSQLVVQWRLLETAEWLKLSRSACARNNVL